MSPCFIGLSETKITKSVQPFSGPTVNRGAVEINAKSPASPKAAKACGKLFQYIMEKSGRNYLLNIEQEGDPDTGPAMAYLNRPDVRKVIPAKSVKKYGKISDFSSNTIY